MKEQEKDTPLNIHLEKDILINEVIYQRYMINRDRVKDAFEHITVPEYIILHRLMEKNSTDLIYGGRIYLAEIADRMGITTSAVSKMVRDLRDRGLVKWAHDGAGESGTYIEITETGKELLSAQAEVIRSFYGRVIEQFGTDKTITLLKLMKELEIIMSTEYEKMEEERRADR